MRKTIAPAEMKRVETYVMEHTSVTGDMLMQRAAAHVADAVHPRRGSGLVLCLCGCGNNGGDGMAAMRILWQRDAAFSGECWVMPGRLSADAQRELERLEKTGVKIIRVGEKLPSAPEKGDCVIDGLFGTGLCRPLDGLMKEACELMNALPAPVVSVDIPSGLSGLTGEVLGAAVKADCTVTFHRPKHGLYLGQGPDFAGEVVVGDIGLPPSMDDADGFAVLEENDLANLLPPRTRVSHKGNYGRVLLWAGSRGMAGAAALAATAALRAGAGLVTVACPETVVDIVQVLCPCATCLPLPEDVDAAWTLLEEAASRCDALGAGCGLGKSEWAAELLKRLIQLDIPKVLDADALNLMAQHGLKASHAFLTPHPAEAARLLSIRIAEVLRDVPAAARRLAENGPVVLKGACSVLCDGQRMAINPFGTPGMAKGGSGDALTGVMAALLAGRAADAYRMNDLELMQAACALHGLAGEMAAQRFGERGMLATDLCSCLGLVGAKKPTIPPVKERRIPSALGRPVTVIVEHKQGTRDELDRSLFYRLNCGYVQEVLSEENEWQDACIFGVNKPVEWFEGTVCAVAVVSGREKWVVSADRFHPAQEDMRRELAFWGTVERVDCL